MGGAHFQKSPSSDLIGLGTEDDFVARLETTKNFSLLPLTRKVHLWAFNWENITSDSPSKNDDDDDDRLFTLS